MSRLNRMHTQTKLNFEVEYLVSINSENLLKGKAFHLHRLLKFNLEQFSTQHLHQTKIIKTNKIKKPFQT